MSFGIATYRANGSVAMSGANKAGIFIQAIQVAYNGSAGSQVFAQIPAGSMFVLTALSGGQWKPVIDSDGAGHARLNWIATGIAIGTTSPTTFLVFAKKVNQTSAFGLVYSNNDGDMPLDITYPVPQYAGTVQPDAHSIRDWFSPDSAYTGHQHVAVVNQRPSTNRIILVNLPDSTSTDAWYSIDFSYLQAGAQDYDPGTGTYTNNIQINLTILKPPGASYQVPTLHVFSLDGPISGGGTFGLQYHNQSGTLVYDSSAENVSIADLTTLDYSGATQAVALNMPAQAGIAIARLQQQIYQSMTTDINGNNGYIQNYAGMVQRRGATLYYRLYDMRDDLTTQTSYFNSQSGVSEGNYTMLVDISQLHPASVTGIPISSPYA